MNYNELPEMTVDEFRSAVAGLDLAQTWFHFEGRIPDIIHTCIQDLRARCPAVKINVEVEKPGRQGLIEVAAEADVVFFSRTWAQSCGFEHCVPFLEAQRSRLPGVQAMFVTWGDEPAAALDRASGEVVLCRPSQVPQVLDTVGAGDTFIAGALYDLISMDGDWNLKQTLDSATNLAGLKVQQEGFNIDIERASRREVSCPL